MALESCAVAERSNGAEVGTIVDPGGLDATMVGHTMGYLDLISSRGWRHHCKRAQRLVSTLICVR